MDREFMVNANCFRSGLYTSPQRRQRVIAATDAEAAREAYRSALYAEGFEHVTVWQVSEINPKGGA